MPEELKKFDRYDLGQLIVRLQGYCLDCPEEKECSPFVTRCPAGMARELLARYLTEGNQFLTDFDAGMIDGLTPAPPGTNKAISEIFEEIPQLCNRCMFHAEKCFLNLVYALMEVAVEGEHTKPLADRPADRAA